MAAMNWLEKRFINSRGWDWLMRRSAAKALRCINDRPKNILEVGCGKGTTTLALAQAFPHAVITAIDVDAEQIELAKRREEPELRQVEFRTGSATATSLSHVSHDAVVSFNTLHHVGDWRQALKEWNRVLLPGGILLLVDVGQLFTQTVHRLMLAKELVYFSRKDIERELVKNGLSIECAKGRVMITLLARKP